MLIILAGTAMASGFSLQNGWKIDPRGIVATLSSAFLYSIYIIANSRLGVKLPVLKKSALMMSGSTLGIVLISANTLIFNSHIDAGLIKWAVFLAVFGTVIPPILFSIGVHKIGVGLSSIIMTAELPVAVIASHIILNEQVTQTQWCGTVLMLCAMALVNISRIHKIQIWRSVHKKPLAEWFAFSRNVPGTEHIF